MIILFLKKINDNAQGHIQEFFQGGPENPLKSIDFTGPGGLAPIAPPEYASELTLT